MCEQFIGDFIYRDSEFTSHCRIAAKTNLLLLFAARFTHARYSSRILLTDFLTGAIMESRKAARSKAVASPPPPPPPPCS